jgi:hypothetical protein
VTIYNADGSQGTQRLMLAINPHIDDVTIAIGEHSGEAWELLADHECFYAESRPEPALQTLEGVFIPGLGCSLWVCG